MTDLGPIRDAIVQLWQTPPSDGALPSDSRGFPALVTACKPLNPRIAAPFGETALENALRAIGAPWMSSGKMRPLPPSPDEAARRIAAALLATWGRRIHLCPLDGADNLPRWSFGNSRVVKLSPSELDALISPSRLLRHHARWVFDSRTFSQIQWLVVEEEVPLDPDPAIRAWPLLGEVVGDVDGRIVPHAARLPPVVEDALFALLLLPWEDVVEYAEYDWRPFRIPWVYTIDDDIFASPKAPPDPTSLRWTEVALSAPDEEVIYDERPDVWPLDVKAVETWPPLDDGGWQRLQVARRSRLLTRPVAHFLVRAFLTDEIDEFLAHITTIEAALALPRDHVRAPSRKKQSACQSGSSGQPIEWRPKLPGNKDPGATERLNMRIARLLELGPCDTAFRQLYAARSNFLHGAAMSDIPAYERLSARRLARKVVDQLVQSAADLGDVDRTDFLTSLCP